MAANSRESSVPASFAAPSADVVQGLVDQAVGFNLFAAASGSQGRKDLRGATAFFATQKLHRFQVELRPPSARGVTASNACGETLGCLDIRWYMTPDDFDARPGCRPPAAELDPAISQRFAMQETVLHFGDGRDGFGLFGTGRTFPMMVGDQPRIAMSAIATVVEGFGKFRGHEGNATLCGDLVPGGFHGNILVRFQDSQCNLRNQKVLPAMRIGADPDPHTTYFLWAGQKGKEQPGVQSHFSIGPDGQVRGMNITTQQRILRLDCAAAGGFEGKPFSIGEDVVGLEIGYGRLSVPGASPIGTQLNPTLFEGVAQYSFFDRAGKLAGEVLISLVEGRRFDMTLPAEPPISALRCGFFGPIIRGSGCFEGAEGIFYGVSGSVFNPPPGDHIVTHFHMMRLSDPEGKFRADTR